ncbi:MAG: tetratricopeptide repeat protein, partial [Armatimonadota bacterium]|nr:tetratricopeptide repeat protein [Armatimonadota bacterium]
MSQRPSQRPSRQTARTTILTVSRLCLSRFSASLLWLALGLLLGSQPAQCAFEYVGVLMNVKPVVQRRSRRDRRFQAVREVAYLREGDVLRTRGAGSATVLFNNGTTAALSGKNPQLQIVPDESAAQPLVIRVLTAGRYWVNPRGNTRVETAAAIAAAQGTQYLLDIPEDDPQTTVLTVIEGTVQFYNPQNPRGGVTVHTGEQSVGRVGQNPTPPRAVDISGLMQWTADITGLPVALETPFLNPKTPGEIAYNAGSYSRAVEEFEKATPLVPQSAEAYYRLGQAKRGQGDVPGAIAAYRQAQQLAPNDPLPRVGEALALLARQDQARPDPAGQEQARQTRQQAREVLIPVQNHALARAVLGLVELREGNNEQSIAHLQDAIKQESQLYQAHALLALALLERNQLPEALVAARKSAELRPDSAQAQGTLAMVLFFAGQTKEATRAARRATKLNPLSPFALLTQGRVFLSQLRTDEARYAYAQAAALAPDLPVISTELGAVYLRLDQVPKAEASYRRAIKLSPNSAEAHTGLGIALARQGQSKEAEAELRKAVDLAPDNPTARANLAGFLIEQGRLVEARGVLSGTKRDDPTYGIIYARLSEISLYLQDLLAAQEDARHAVRLLPNSAIAHYQLGRVYLEQGRTVQAEQQFRQAATLDPQFAEARFGLGFTRELAESGLFGTSLSAAAGTLGSAGGIFDLHNFQSPGAEDRLQAFSQKPAVARIASRASGDTQLGALVGEADSQNYDFSHLHTFDGRRSVFGLTGERRETNGVRKNADISFNRFGLLYGQQEADNPSASFILGDYEKQDVGRNTEFSSQNAETLRVASKLPRFLAGFNLQTSERSRTRFVVQGSQPHFKQTDLA